MPQLGFIAMRAQDARDRPYDHDRHHDSAASMREIYRDVLIPIGRDQLPECERKIRNRQTGAEMAHHRADQDLQIDDRGGYSRQHR